MGELIQFPSNKEHRDPRDISGTKLGQRIIGKLAAPIFADNIAEASDESVAPTTEKLVTDINSGRGEWAVIPLESDTPEGA